ncbi:MAG: DUF1566 domain-containing protein [Campylobacterota bacterium]|nr:DUF1566 domain-containing protein [Campylobacterota bacterium]
MKPILLMLMITGTLLNAASSKQDDKTGLVWQDNQDVAQTEMNYDEGKEYCQKLKLDGFEDWRLPTLREAYTIVDLTQDRPALKNGFEIRKSERFWTVTPSVENPEKEAWLIAMSYGEAEPYRKDRAYSVRCVRGQLAK